MLLYSFLLDIIFNILKKRLLPRIINYNKIIDHVALYLMVKPFVSIPIRNRKSLLEISYTWLDLNPQPSGQASMCSCSISRPRWFGNCMIELEN